MKLLQKFKDTKREVGELKRFFNADASNRAITCYSEGEMYYRYFEGLIDVLTKKYGTDISYLTSDPNDRVFNAEKSPLHPFFIKDLLKTTFSKFDGKVLLMTVPDLNHPRCPKRAPDPAHHVYLFHTMVSTHLIYRHGAFDFYDAILCAGPHHVEEIRRAEKMYKLKPKTLVECGYPFLEKIYTEHRDYLRKQKTREKKRVLIAPTWGKVCILNSCIYELLDALAKSEEYEVILRPHPEFIKREPKKAHALSKKVNEMPNVMYEENLLSTRTLHEADVLITDQSGIAFEYALGTERPVLFIDTPLKIGNPRWRELGIEPIEITLRSQLGVRVPLERAGTIVQYIRNLEAGQGEFQKNIRAIRNKHVFNWMHSAEVGAAYIENAQKSIH